MLTDEQLRSGLINPASRWPNGVVPFVIDDVFSEYGSTKLRSGLRGVEELSMHYEYRYTCGAHWSLSGRSNSDKYLFLSHNNLTHSHSHMSNQPCKYALDLQITITSHSCILLKAINRGRFYDCREHNQQSNSQLLQKPSCNSTSV